MSDLAPFVAATLRDKVVADLKEEIERLQNKLGCARAVEITGENGSPVYARADLEKDGDYHGNPNLWQVQFPPHQRELAPCSFKDLSKAEIRIGGILIRKFSEEGYYVYLDGLYHIDVNDSPSGDMNGKIISSCFSAGAVWCVFSARGLSEDYWEIFEADEAFQSTPLDLFDSVHALSSDSRITFLYVTPSIEFCNIPAKR